VILTRPQLTVLLNGLYETDKRRVTVEHPSPLGKLLRFDLEAPFASPVRFERSLTEYEETREAVEREHGETAKEELPDDASYVRALAGSGVIDVANRDAIATFVGRHGYPDLAAGHPPVVAGIDTNLVAWRIGDVLGIDPETGEEDGQGRAPTNGYALSTGVKAELEWHYKQHRTTELVAAFGDAYDRLDGQPAGANREGFLGRFEYRRLVAERDVDIVKSEPGDAEIVEAYREFDEGRKDVVLFSNDYGFVELATEGGLHAQHVDFPRKLPRRTTASWDELSDLLYYLAVTFGVVSLPGATLYGVWQGKQNHHWQEEAIAVEPRSPKLEPILERDRTIVEAFEG
jgi:hypothetical protein